MATLENGENNAESSRRGISFEFQSKDLPSRRLLGKGLSGIGYETAWKGARYARKDFVGVHRDIFLQEVTVLVNLKDHKNIVKTYGWTIDKRSCSLVLEYMDEDLLSLLQKRMDSKRGVVGKDLGEQSSTSTSTQPVDLPEAVDMMLQIATGVEYLHERGLAHGDLKTKNILVTHRTDGAQSSKVLKLSDFGLVGTKRKSRYIVSREVRKLDTVRWKSPEYLKILSRRLHSSNGDEDETSSESESESTPSSVPAVSSACAGIKSSDVYSFALICFQILTGHTPYSFLAWKELMDKILLGFRPELPVSCHPLLRELLISCWGDPAERPSFSDVRMKLIQVQGLLTTAMGKRPQEATVPSMVDSPAHQAAAVPSTEVSTSSGNCLSPKPSKGPAMVPPEWTASVATMRSDAPGVPLAASSAPSPPATAAASPAADESYVEFRSLVGIVPSSEPTQSEAFDKCLKEPLLRDFKPNFDCATDGWRFLDQYYYQLFTPCSDLNNDPIVVQGSNLAGTSLSKKLIENEGGTSRICDISATEVKTVVGMETSPPALTHSPVGDDMLDMLGDGAQIEAAQEEDFALPIEPSEGGRVNELPFESSSFPSGESGNSNDNAGNERPWPPRERPKNWSKKETDDLLRAVLTMNKQGTCNDSYWDAMAMALPDRTGYECRRRMDTLKISFYTTKRYCDELGKEFKQLNEMDFRTMKVSLRLTEDWYNQIRDLCPPRPKKQIVYHPPVKSCPLGNLVNPPASPKVDLDNPLASPKVGSDNSRSLKNSLARFLDSRKREGKKSH